MIGFLGDLQRTSWIERAIGREQNDAPRRRIAASLAEEPLELLVLLGDLLPRPLLDALLEPVRRRSVPIDLVLGNHDGRGDRERFPRLAREPWVVRRHGDVSIALLDSNRGRLGRTAWAAQAAWLASTLAALDDDPAVRFTIVACHHPPFTNSRVTGDEAHVQEAFLDPFQAAAKARLFVSGHAHAYEHFEHGGRHFVVSGGGGGPRVRLHEGRRSRHEDRFAGPSPRPFHYLLVERAGEGLRVRAKGFADAGAPAAVFDEFAV